MASFLVFRDLPGVTRDQYTAAARRCRLAGRQVTYRGGFFLPRAGRAIGLFDAESAADVAEVNDQAGVPVTEVAEAIDLRARP